MSICSALAVIQLLRISPGSCTSFQSLAVPVLFSAINVFLVMLCFQTNKLGSINQSFNLYTAP